MNSQDTKEAIKEYELKHGKGSVRALIDSKLIELRAKQ